MRYLKIFVVSLLCATTLWSASAVTLDGRPRKKKRKKKIEYVREEQQAPLVETVKIAEPVVEQEPDPVTQLTEPMKTDLDLGFSREQSDSLLTLWREQKRVYAFEDFFENYVRVDTTVIDTTPDSVYIKRLYDLVSPIPLPYNHLVKNSISRYTGSRSGVISRVLGRSQYYFPMIEEELIKANLPVELRSLAIIESALMPNALSRVGASGLWQFMPSTGKSCGLEVNSVVDERRDPLRATQAACRYLKDLYNIYKDWTLAIAAYNCGPGNVNKAFARAGGNSRTFWDIYYFLPRETRDYVPAFIAANYAYAYHKQHGIEVTESPVPLSVDTIRVNRLMHLEQISSTIDVDLETLRQLNPQYKIDIIPATTKPYSLVLPQRNITEYIEHEQEIFAKDSTYLKQYINPANLDKKKMEHPAGATYRVKRGDTLGGIAHRHRVSVKQLMRLNNIRNPRALRIGQRLRIR